MRQEIMNTEQKKTAMPRVILAASGSGTGKTTITCGILQCLLNRGKKVVSFKCGPDYIDPMFHKQVLGIPSKNLDAFFINGNALQKVFRQGAKGLDISVIEGVMGYYDGIGASGMEASTYDLAVQLDTPVILIVNARGMSTSVLALIKGFLSFQKESLIKGVILNRVSEKTYRRLKPEIEKMGVKALGYVSTQKNMEWGSRHLGLLLPDEIGQLQAEIAAFSKEIEKTLDLEGLIELANSASPVIEEAVQNAAAHGERNETVRIGVARDEAFCFYYQDNLELLREKGAELVYFSPLSDQRLPDKLDGILFGGGYPENHAKQLSENVSMKESVKNRIQEGIPYLAECGGFLYLQDSIKVEEQVYPMCGVLKGHAKNQGKLTRFGYIQLVKDDRNENCETSVMLSQTASLQEKLQGIKGHEFHYYDTDDNGEDMIAVKPDGRSFQCLSVTDHSVAGFPHLYYPSKPEFVEAFLDCCRAWRNG